MNLQGKRGIINTRMQEAVQEIRKKGKMKTFYSKYAFGVNALSKSNIEKSLPSATILIAIADYTGISADYILGNSDKKYMADTWRN